MHDRLTADPGPESGPVGMLEQRQGGGKRQEGKHLHEEAAHEKVEAGPRATQRERSAGPGSQQPFDGNEDDAGEDQVEQEPVEPQIDVAIEIELVLGPRAAQRGGRAGSCPRAEKPRIFCLPQDDADDPQ